LNLTKVFWILTSKNYGPKKCKTLELYLNPMHPYWVHGEEDLIMKKKTFLFGSLLFLLGLPLNAWAAFDVPAKVYEMGTDNAPVPVSGVKVDVFVGRALKASVFSGETNASGACLLRDIPLGKDVLMRLAKPGYVPQFDIRSYSDRDVDEGVILWIGSEVHVDGVYKNLGERFDVQKGHTYLEIRSELTGEGIEGVRLTIASGKAFDLGSGEYLVANAEGTSLKIGIHKPGFAADIESVAVPLFPGGITQFEVVVQPGGVFTANGEIEIISAPNIPNGPATGNVSTEYAYITGGSSSNLGHPIQYQFDWGDGTESGWLLVGNTSALKSWSVAANYPVKAKARCAIHPSIESTWSSIFFVNISSSISPVSPPNEQHFDGCSLYALPTFSWNAGEPFKKYEVQFSLDPGFASIPVKAITSGYVTGVVVKSSIWKKVMLIPGESGGMVYWRVVGTRPKQPKVISQVRSFIVDPAQAVGNRNIINTSKSSLPELSWQNNCNVKFNLWFGSNETFTKEAKVGFKITNPYENGGALVKILRLNQWKKIRNLVNDVGGSTLYWYVESWDGFKRNVKTEVMSFVLTN